MFLRVGIAILGWFLVVLQGSVFCLAQEDKVASVEPTSWLRGRAFQLAAREQVLSIDWAQVPLRDHIRPLALFRKTSIFLDRRLDPQLPITLSLENSTLEQILWRIADQHSWGVAELENGYYLGPADQAMQLTHLVFLWQQPNTPLSDQNFVAKLQRELVVHTTKPVEPRALIEELAQSIGMPLSNPEAIPHDLWAPLDLPRASAWQQLQLLLIGFDLQLEATSDGQLKVLPLELKPPFTRRISGLKQPGEWSQRLQAQAPQLQVEASGDRLDITGSQEELLLAGKALATLHRPSPRAATPAQMRYTLNTKAQRGAILASVAKQLSVEWTYPTEQRRLMEQMVEINVNEVDLAELMKLTLDGTDLAYRLSDGKLEIYLKESP